MNYKWADARIDIFVFKTNIEYMNIIQGGVSDHDISTGRESKNGSDR